jgi:hypothetical protein
LFAFANGKERKANERQRQLEGVHSQSGTHCPTHPNTLHYLEVFIYKDLFSTLHPPTP